ncbi:MAG: TRAP transporter substrate-binding protein DctP [Desulfoprunum sp.]|jgi:TRAP-type C4-dicarboxylate transport system substrate-binding protein|uniref:TRAP transporter substrate-binding protein n=1 Tax=Desulfoprunum sp. TaxID=2020866 RepID=UPI00052D92A8|nr:TRAP dicarboxylate transporter subunit DctP [Desulfobulbus sp. Tol-SR]
MRPVLSLFLVGLILLVSAVRPADARPRHLFKIGSLAPEGSVWILQFQEFAREVEEKTGGEVGFRVYAGGIMGDDQAMYRKIRIGQLQGGGFTMTGIAQVVPDFRIMALPFLFTSYQEVDAVTRGLLPKFRQQFAEQGLELIAMTEVGFIYTMSTMPIVTIDNLRQATCWTPTGDPVSSTYLSQLGITPVQLSIPDVLSSLQTGLVNTVFNSLYGSIVLQWFTKAKYINDLPFGYAYGALLLDQKALAKLPKDQAAIIQTTADKYFPPLIAKTRQSNEESRDILAENGVRFTTFPTEVAAQLQGFRDQTAKAVIGSSFSREIHDETTRLLQEFRSGR